MTIKVGHTYYLPAARTKVILLLLLIGAMTLWRRDPAPGRWPFAFEPWLFLLPLAGIAVLLSTSCRIKPDGLRIRVLLTSTWYPWSTIESIQLKEEKGEHSIHLRTTGGPEVPVPAFSGRGDRGRERAERAAADLRQLMSAEVTEP